MKIYIAGSIHSQERLRECRNKLFALGHDVISTWLDECTLPVGMTREVFDRQLALKDFTEVRAADCLILDNLDESSTGGRYVEWGYAFGHPKLRLSVGESNNIFTHLADINFPHWENLLSYFALTHPSEKYVPTGAEGDWLPELD